MLGNFSQTFAYGRYVQAVSGYPAIAYPAIEDLRYMADNLSGSAVTESNGTGKSLSTVGGVSAVTLAGVSTKVFDMRVVNNNYMLGPTHNFGTNVTVSAWINIPTANQQSNIHCWFSTGAPNLLSDGFKFDINNWQSNDRALVIEFGNNISGAAWTSPAGTFQLDQWQMLTYSIDSNAKWAQMTRNDVIAFTPPANTDRDRVVSGTNMNKAFRIGDMQGSYPFNGYINDIRVHRGIITQQQITDLYNNTKATYGL
jgi:hypothetical protein